MEAMEEEKITLSETAAVVGLLALSIAIKHRQQPRRRF